MITSKTTVAQLYSATTAQLRAGLRNGSVAVAAFCNGELQRRAKAFAHGNERTVRG